MTTSNSRFATHLITRGHAIKIDKDASPWTYTFDAIEPDIWKRERDWFDRHQIGDKMDAYKGLLSLLSRGKPVKDWLRDKYQALDEASREFGVEQEVGGGE